MMLHIIHYLNIRLKAFKGRQPKAGVYFFITIIIANKSDKIMAT